MSVGAESGGSEFHTLRLKTTTVSNVQVRKETILSSVCLDDVGGIDHCTSPSAHCVYSG